MFLIYIIKFTRSANIRAVIHKASAEGVTLRHRTPRRLMRQTSIVTRVSAMLTSIVLLAVAAMMTSYYISDRADDDAYAINLAGSLRWQSFRLGLLLSQPEPDLKEIRIQTERIDKTWAQPVFIAQRKSSPEVAERYTAAFNYWQ